MDGLTECTIVYIRERSDRFTNSREDPLAQQAEVGEMLYDMQRLGVTEESDSLVIPCRSCVEEEHRPVLLLRLRETK
jgi:hypothetical protein